MKIMDLEPAYLSVRLREIIAGLDGVNEEFEPSEILDSMRLDELGIESLDRADLAMWIEQEFGIDIPSRRIFRTETVGDVLALLAQENR